MMFRKLGWFQRVLSNPLKVARHDAELHLHTAQDLSYHNDERGMDLYCRTNECSVFNPMQSEFFLELDQGIH
jgi:hypothetical protein